ncbi:hypothetical protein GMMP15_680007 [Candidatus Magnetomoraceae bacterium gMMP-15]
MHDFVGLDNGLPADYSKDGEVEILELALYVKSQMKSLNPNQTPNLALPKGLDNLPFFLQ